MSDYAASLLCPTCCPVSSSSSMSSSQSSVGDLGPCETYIIASETLTRPGPSLFWFTPTFTWVLYGPGELGPNWVVTNGTGQWEAPPSWNGRGCYTFTLVSGSGSATLEVCCGDAGPAALTITPELLPLDDLPDVHLVSLTHKVPRPGRVKITKVVAPPKPPDKPAAREENREREKPKRVPLCMFEGDLYTGSERVKLGLSHTKKWKPCNHPAQPKGPHVCSCLGCGVSCPGYVADPDRA